MDRSNIKCLQPDRWEYNQCPCERCCDIDRSEDQKWEAQYEQRCEDREIEREEEEACRD